MQEILFHGKLLSNGKWVEGCLLIYGKRYFIIPSEELIESEVESRFYWHLLEKHYEVVPETVGPFIGLTDINGKKIFVGDVVRHYNDSSDPDWYDKGTVHWNQSKCMYCRNSYFNETNDVQMCEANKYEVVCSIHDIVLD